MRYGIVLSGGVGTRMQTKIPKQYIRIRGKMLITYTIETLLASGQIDELLIVANEKWHEAIRTDCIRFGIAVDKLVAFVTPGSNRQCSIYNGLRWLMEHGPNDGGHQVLIHDAVRPLATTELIASCFAVLQQGYDGVLPVLPMKDTIYAIDETKELTLLDRSSLFAGQAPEAFELQKYYEANCSLLPDRILSINGSSEPAILAGLSMTTIPGDERNFKITTKEDLERFEQIVFENGDEYGVID